MRIHLTCSRPQRRLVIAMHAARTLLVQAGHAVSVSWPETWEDADGHPRLGFNRAAIAAADVIVHAALVDEALPTELVAVADLGRPVLRYAPGHEARARGGDSPLVVSAADVVDAVADACAATVS